MKAADAERDERTDGPGGARDRADGLLVDVVRPDGEHQGARAMLAEP